MKDQFLIFQSGLCDFSAAEWGVLKFKDGIFDLDEPKAFNRQRRMLNAGGNMSRILRSSPWGVPDGQMFDYTHPQYFPILRRYLKILNNPCQTVPTGQGARVVIEPFDGCSEKWMYTDHKKAGDLLRTFLANTADLDFVDIGSGNECEDNGYPHLFRDVIIPAFDDFKKIPFSYGSTYNFRNSVESEKRIHDCKAAASKKWGDLTSFAIFKQVHGCCNKTSENLIQAVAWWAKHNMATFYSVDGCKRSKSPCDFYQDQVRPSREEFAEMVKYVLDYIKTMLHPKYKMTTGQVKCAFEFISKVWNNDQCGTLPIMAVSDLHKAVFGVYPFNWGKYPNDWVEPPPPGPEPEPEPPIPPTPPVQIKPCCYFWNRHNYWHWLRCILFGNH